jgi:hypothetical protein
MIQFSGKRKHDRLSQETVPTHCHHLVWIEMRRKTSDHAFSSGGKTSDAVDLIRTGSLRETAQDQFRFIDHKPEDNY